MADLAYKNEIKEECLVTAADEAIWREKNPHLIHDVKYYCDGHDKYDSEIKCKAEVTFQPATRFKKEHFRVAHHGTHIPNCSRYEESEEPSETRAKVISKDPRDISIDEIINRSTKAEKEKGGPPPKGPGGGGEGPGREEHIDEGFNYFKPPQYRPPKDTKELYWTLSENGPDMVYDGNNTGLNTLINSSTYIKHRLGEATLIGSGLALATRSPNVKINSALQKKFGESCWVLEDPFIKVSTAPYAVKYILDFEKRNSLRKRLVEKFRSTNKKYKVETEIYLISGVWEAIEDKEGEHRVMRIKIYNGKQIKSLKSNDIMQIDQVEFRKRQVFVNPNSK